MAECTGRTMRIFFAFCPDKMDGEVRVDTDVCVGDWEIAIVAGVLSMNQHTHICIELKLDSSSVNFATLITSGTLRVGWFLRTWEAFLTVAFRMASSLDISGVC